MRHAAPGRFWPFIGGEEYAANTRTAPCVAPAECRLMFAKAQFTMRSA